MVRALYRLALWLAFPLIWLYLLKRSRKQPAYRQHWAERLGFYGAQPAVARRYWIHAVSVGEMRAAAPVIAGLRERDPDAEILLTCMTPTGRATADEVLGGKGYVVYLPYDYPGAVSRFLRHWRPAFGLIMETELWPNLLHGCADAGIPLYLGNARLSARSAAGYQRIAPLIRPALARLAGVLAQDEADAQRLAALGARAVQVVGSVKFDMPVNPALQLQGRRWRALFGDRPVLLLASSREGEEALVLDALQGCGWPAGLLLIVVPRHPQRFDAVAALLAERGLPAVRRSQWDGHSAIPAATAVLLGDSMGEMGAWYAAAGAQAEPVLMGGSLLPFGSQNLIEACAQGAPVVLGPSTFNFAAVAAAAVTAGAACQVQGIPEALDRAMRLLADAPARRQMGAAGLAFAAAHRGATARLLAALPVA